LREALRVVAVIAAAAILHELGHIVVAWGCGIPVKTLRLDLFGARMELGGMLSYKRELAVAAGGPFVNLLSAVFVLPFCVRWGFEGSGGLFLAASVCLGGLNLLPVQSLDGGRMLNAALSLLFGAEVGDGAVRLTTGLFLGGLWLLSVYALLRVGHMLTLFAFTLCLLFRLLVPETGQK
jgi:stage IV sporulation protein FB